MSRRRPTQSMIDLACRLATEGRRADDADRALADAALEELEAIELAAAALDRLYSASAPVPPLDDDLRRRILAQAPRG